MSYLLAAVIAAHAQATIVKPVSIRDGVVTSEVRYQLTEHDGKKWVEFE